MLPAIPYVIASTGKESKRTVFLVDRVVHRDRFWVTNPDEAKVFLDLEVASLACMKLKFNKPHVIELSQAKAIFFEEERKLCAIEIEATVASTSKKLSNFPTGTKELLGNWTEVPYIDEDF